MVFRICFIRPIFGIDPNDKLQILNAELFFSSAQYHMSKGSYWLVRVNMIIYYDIVNADSAN